MAVTIDRQRERVIFGRELEMGMTLVERCHGIACDFGTTHTESPIRQPAAHEVTIKRLNVRGRHFVKKPGRWFSKPQMGFQPTYLDAVVEDEEGNEHPWQGPADKAYRVLRSEAEPVLDFYVGQPVRGKTMARA